MIDIKKLLLVLGTVLLLTGCSTKIKDNLEEFKKYNNKKTSYVMKGQMEIVSNEDVYTYDLNVSVKDQTYYKVILTNTLNNHEQIILKNDDGVYVVTPDVNKSFKFSSNWPSNSSQAYLIESVVKDVLNDNEASIEDKDDGYKITAKVNYPNNSKMSKENIIIDKDYNIKEVDVLDNDGNTLIKVKVSDIDYKPSFDTEYFKIDENTCEDDTCSDKETSNTLEEIIYPLYVPADTYLSSKDTVATDDGNRYILTFAGVDPFILVEEVSKYNNELEIIPVNGEPLLVGSTIGALSDNSLYFSSNGVDFYITSSTLDGSSLMTIAESIQNSNSLVASVK